LRERGSAARPLLQGFSPGRRTVDRPDPRGAAAAARSGGPARPL